MTLVMYETLRDGALQKSDDLLPVEISLHDPEAIYTTGWVPLPIPKHQGDGNLHDLVDGVLTIEPCRARVGVQNCVAIVIKLKCLDRHYGPTGPELPLPGSPLYERAAGIQV